MDFLKLFADMEQLFEPYTDEERGRLLTAMMAYAFRGEDTEFEGNERFLWPVLRRHIEQCIAYSDRMAELGRKGGKASAASSESKRRLEPLQAEASAASSGSKLQEQEQEHIQEQEQGVTVKRAQARRFTPPTIEEVRDYCQERRNHVDPQRFINHYSSNGWRVGKNPMKDWKAAVRNWEGNEYTSGTRDSPANQGIMSRTEEHKNTPGFWESIEVDLDAADEHGRLPGEVGYRT